MLARCVFVALWVGILAPPLRHGTLEAQPPTIHDLISDCARDYDIPMGDLFRVLAHPGSPTRPIPMLQCSVLCYMVRAGFMDSDGYFDMDKIQAKVTSPNRHVYDSMMQCRDTPGDNHCHRAYQINMCIGLRIFEKEFDHEMLAL